MIKGVAVKSSEEVPKFMVDGMLGKLCRWLRFFGFDAEYAGEAKQRRTFWNI